jgi:DNA-binding MarR family transcriptional regulator
MADDGSQPARATKLDRVTPTLRALDERLTEHEMTTGCFANRPRAASRAITRHDDAGLKPPDLRVSQLSVLIAFSLGKSEFTIIQAAEGLGMDRSALSRNLDPLARQGPVELGPEAGHRACHVNITEAGTAGARRCRPRRGRPRGSGWPAGSTGLGQQRFCPNRSSSISAGARAAQECRQPQAAEANG